MIDQNYCSFEYAESYVQQLIENKFKDFQSKNIHIPKITCPKITWRPMGVRFAGYAIYGRNEIQLNTNYLTSESWQDFLNRTPIHELAHLISYFCYCEGGHGKRWKEVCVKLGIEPPVVITTKLQL